MKDTEQRFLSVVLAALPLLDQADSFHSAFRTGGIVALAFWLTLFFFKLTQPLFPQKLLGISVVLWVAFGAEAVTTYSGNLEPLWSLSLLLLLFPYTQKDLGLNPIDSWRKVTAVIFQEGVGFLILLTYLGLSREILRKVGVVFFDQPAGVLFLIALAGWLVQNQPGAGRYLKQAETVKRR